MNFLPALLQKLTQNSLDAYIIYHADEHLSEFFAESDMRVKALTGFTGSNATVVITQNENVLYTDNRYFLQAENELIAPFELKKSGEDESIYEFLSDQIGEGRVGLDLRYISHLNYKTLKNKLKKKNITLVPVKNELFDSIWDDKPSRTNKKLIDLEKMKFSEYITFFNNNKIRNIYKNLFEDKYSYEYSEMVESELIPGINYRNKIEIVQKNLKSEEGIILSKLDTIAWLLNLRGEDIVNNTVFYAFAYLTNENITVFTNNFFDREVEKKSYDEFYSFLENIQESKILVSDHVNAKIVEIIGEERIIENNSIEKLKSIKNENEIAGFFQAAIFDGVALVKLFSWIYNTKEELNELQISNKLLEIKKKLILDVDKKSSFTRENNPSRLKENGKDNHENVFHVNFIFKKAAKDFISHLQYRSKLNNAPIQGIQSNRIETKFKDSGFLFPSFSTIVASGSNGAIVHHAADNTAISEDKIILIDSGSQFIYGTTDITRTIHSSEPNTNQIHDYTIVLKGQLLAKRLKGPSQEIASMIQNLPKYYLWAENKTYGHGTSHGIGTGLNVHEMPPFEQDELIIEPHQIFTIEPGFYKTGEYGIRIEDAVISLLDHNIFLQNMTFVPHQLSFIDENLLTEEEKEYFNDYNKLIKEILEEYLTDEKEVEWLRNNTLNL